MRRGFTLIELLVVIAIIAILAVVVVLTLNPAELLRQSRDSNRVSDMATLTSALNLYNTDQGGATSYNMGSINTVYVSLPDPAATSTAGTNCSTMGLPTLPPIIAPRLPLIGR
jgi:prepilin-type N-terminal cleavage/methylation domain-containing protein